MKQKGLLFAAVFWILGLALFLVGLNLSTDAGKWLTVIGQILFLLGLLIEGVIWFRKKQSEPKEK